MGIARIPLVVLEVDVLVVVDLTVVFFAFEGGGLLLGIPREAW